LVIAILAPLGLGFLTSLLLAVLVLGAGAALAALFLPRFLKRPAMPPSSPKTIELDASQYRHIESRPPRDRQ
jgi:hypothetical protein